MSFLFRVFLFGAGALFAASLAVSFMLMAGIWGLRSAWARLTGRQVMPFMMRIDPRAGFDRMYRRAPPSSRTPRADAVQPAGKIGDVSDVEARAPRP